MWSRVHPEATVAPFVDLGALSKRNDSPETASRPFDADRDGFIAGEGGGILVLESEEHARKRGAKILAELTGWEMFEDGLSMTDLDTDRAASAIRTALYDKRAKKIWVPDAVSAHGTSTPVGDRNEIEALRKALGEKLFNVYITALKDRIGHTMGGSGSVAAAVAIQMLMENKIPPIMNLKNIDPEIQDGEHLLFVLDKAKEVLLNRVLVESFGFGGNGAVLVFKRYEREERDIFRRFFQGLGKMVSR